MTDATPAPEPLEAPTDAVPTAPPPAAPEPSGVSAPPPPPPAPPPPPVTPATPATPPPAPAVAAPPQATAFPTADVGGQLPGDLAEKLHEHPEWADVLAQIDRERRERLAPGNRHPNTEVDNTKRHFDSAQGRFVD